MAPLNVKLITAIYEAGFTGKTVELPVTGDDSYCTAGGMTSRMRHFYEKCSLERVCG